MRTGNLTWIALCAAVALGLGAAGCAAGKVKITKTAKTMIGDEVVQWDGSYKTSTPGGYNQAELKKWLKKAGIEPKKLAVAVTRDIRACDVNSASVELAGSYEYDGFKAEFDYVLNEHIAVPIPIDTPANVAKHCNKMASKSLAQGLARSLRDNDKL
jgi:hypothetical protein